MKRLCIIPARGGSKRIPRKNIKLFLGRPIIAYSIQAALESELFDEVMVSTDDEEIARIAKDYGAGIPFLRSKETSGDTATTLEVLLEILSNYEIRQRAFTDVCCIYPASPFVNPQVLTKGYNLLIERNFDCVFPVLRYGHPVQRALKVEDDGRMSLSYPEYSNTRSQDLQPTYHDAGMFYWFRPEIIRSRGSLWTDNSGCIEVSELHAQDIDNPVDWELAELKYKYFAKR